MKNTYDCMVIGGGVAGSTAAYHLAKLGYEVVLLEKAQGPHHKVCGEFLSFEALGYLQEMGIGLSDDSPVVRHFQLSSPRSTAHFTFPYPGRGISRYKLDEELLSNAGNAGAHVVRGVCLKSYHQENGLIRVETNAEDFYARHVFIATGKYDHSKEHKRRGKDQSYIGLKTHLRARSAHDKFKDTTVLFSFPGGYGGICPVEEGAINFCFVINKKIYKSLNSNWDAVVAFLRRSNPRLDLILEQAELMTPVCAIGYIPYGFLRRQSSDGNIYFLGDQRMVIPSFTGDGMAIALGTAKSCAYEFDGRQKGLPIRVEPSPRTLKTQMRWALTAQTLLKSPWLTEACMSIPRCSSFLIETFFQKTRIPKTKDLRHDLKPPIFENNYSGH